MAKRDPRRRGGYDLGPAALTPMQEKIEEAVTAFNHGEYFEAAECFEGALAGTSDELHNLLIALSRVAAAFHLRFERGGRQSSINLISQALQVLDELRPASAGIDVERLYVELNAMVDEIRASPREERQGMRYRARLFVERRRAPRINAARGR